MAGKDDQWRQEPWAKANMERWARLRARGFEFKNAEQKKGETGVTMSHPQWKYALTVYAPHFSDTTRQEIYENWIEQCEFYIDCPPRWEDAVKHIFQKSKEAVGEQSA